MITRYYRLKLPVWASNRAVIRATRRKISRKHRKTLEHKSARKALYRQMLEYHNAGYNQYVQVTSGRFGS